MIQQVHHEVRELVSIYFISEPYLAFPRDFSLFLHFLFSFFSCGPCAEILGVDEWDVVVLKSR